MHEKNIILENNKEYSRLNVKKMIKKIKVQKKKKSSTRKSIHDKYLLFKYFQNTHGVNAIKTINII